MPDSSSTRRPNAWNDFQEQYAKGNPGSSVHERRPQAYLDPKGTKAQPQRGNENPIVVQQNNLAQQNNTSHVFIDNSTRNLVAQQQIENRSQSWHLGLNQFPGNEGSERRGCARQNAEEGDGDGAPRFDSWRKTVDVRDAVREVPALQPPLTWDDYIADPKTKSQFQRICRTMGAPETDAARALQWIRGRTRGERAQDAKDAHRLCLLHGEPGNGKTYCLKVLASVLAEVGVKVYEINLTSVKSTWSAQTEAQLSNLLDYIGGLENAIVFLDEVRRFFPERKSRHCSSWIFSCESEIRIRYMQHVKFLLDFPRVPLPPPRAIVMN